MTTTTPKDEIDDTDHLPLDERTRLDTIRGINAIGPTIVSVHRALIEAQTALINDETSDPAARRAAVLLSSAREDVLRLRTALGILLDGITEATVPKYEADP